MVRENKDGAQLAIDLLKEGITPMTGLLGWLAKGVEISMVFQDPMSSLNPSMRVGKQALQRQVYFHIVLPKVL